MYNFTSESSLQRKCYQPDEKMEIVLQCPKCLIHFMFLERKVYIISSANNDSIFNQINQFFNFNLFSNREVSLRNDCQGLL